MLTALYDGNCLLCQRSCAILRALDWRRRIRFVDLHESEPGLPREQLLGEIHALDEAGALHSGFYAARRLLKELPLAIPLWLLLHLPGMGAFGRRAYRFIARRRYRFNRILGGTSQACADECCAINL